MQLEAPFHPKTICLEYTTTTTVRDSQRKRGTHPLEARIEFPLCGGARRAPGSALATWPSPRGRDGLPHVRDPASQSLTSRVGTDPPVLANQTISNPHMRSRTHAATRDIKPPQQALVKLILIYLLIPKLIP